MNRELVPGYDIMNNYRCFCTGKIEGGQDRAFCSEVVLRTIKNYKGGPVYPGSGPFYKVIALRPVFVCIEDEQCYNAG
jgi:hypothetical protein